MENYIKEYADIGFRVVYSYNKSNFDKLVFAVHPIEELAQLEHPDEEDNYLMYGHLDLDLQVYVGFRSFLVKMNKDFHKRLGKLYGKLSREFLNVYDKNG